MAVENPFPYPGGKAYHADWILEFIPDHYCYCEPFAGSAAVLFRKQPSKVEIINDRDSDVVQFFRVLRERREELEEWLKYTPYARDTHRKFAGEFYSGYRPDDPIERAGRFFYLRYSQYAGKFRTKSGLGSGATRNKALQLQNAARKLDQFAERLQRVQIENRDYAEIVNRFDGENVVFYFDPPYVNAGDALYTGDDFDHSRFVNVLEDIEGDWLLSYEDIPDGLDLEDYYVDVRERRQYMSEGRPEAGKHGTERLIMNFDPTKRPRFSGPEQATLGFVNAAEEGGESE